MKNTFAYIGKFFVENMYHLSPEAITVFVVLKSGIRGKSDGIPTSHSLVEISEYTNLSNSQILFAINELIILGFVKKEKTFNKEKNRWNTNIYIIYDEIDANILNDNIVKLERWKEQQREKTRERLKKYKKNN